MRLEARPDALWVQSALSEGSTEYRAFDRVVSSGEAVLLKTRNGSSYTVLPAQLFPPATLAEVGRRVTAASEALAGPRA